VSDELEAVRVPRGLTLTQPWCGLMAAGIKLVENRPRRMIKPSYIGKRLALHASREIDLDVYDRIREIAPELYGDFEEFTDEELANGDEVKRQPWYRLSRITSSIIAVATLDSVVFDDTGLLRADIDRQLGDQRRWFFGPVGYVLRDVVALPRPVPCKGMLGLWTLPALVELDVIGQLAGLGASGLSR
jgi:hypothetical protein